MKIIKDELLRKQPISTNECFSWVEETFLMKTKSILPAKISMKPEEDVFFNVMPSIIKEYNVVGNKIVSRIPERNPLIKSEIFLYDLKNGNLKAILEGNYITSLRTGALAAYNAINFANEQDSYEVGMIGLGNVATMTANFLFDKFKNKKLKVKLYKYNDDHIKFHEKFKCYSNFEFVYVSSYEEVIRNSDIIISGISYTDQNFGEVEWFKKGVVIIPIHTRGFQNLDMIADKVIVDDRNHVKNFKYYNKFKKCVELSEILEQKEVGRESRKDIILIYTIGISLLDVMFSLKLLEKLRSEF